MGFWVFDPDERKQIMCCRDKDFPYKSVLSFSGLIDFWRGLLSKGAGAETAIFKTVEAALKDAPEMLAPIEDLGVLEKHGRLVEMLMSLVIPPAFMDRDYAAAFVPFQVAVDGHVRCGVAGGRIEGDVQDAP